MLLAVTKRLPGGLTSGAAGPAVALPAERRTARHEKHLIVLLLPVLGQAARAGLSPPLRDAKTGKPRP